MMSLTPESAISLKYWKSVPGMTRGGETYPLELLLLPSAVRRAGSDLTMALDTARQEDKAERHYFATMI